jgi:hypothetical protein
MNYNGIKVVRLKRRAGESCLRRTLPQFEIRHDLAMIARCTSEARKGKARQLAHHDPGQAISHIAQALTVQYRLISNRQPRIAGRRDVNSPFQNSADRLDRALGFVPHLSVLTRPNLGMVLTCYRVMPAALFTWNIWPALKAPSGMARIRGGFMIRGFKVTY